MEETATGEKAQREKKRCAEEILQCTDELAAKEEQIVQLQKEVHALRKRKEELESEQQFALVSRLKKDGADAWNGLNYENKWKKEILLDLFESGKIPHTDTFKGNSWNLVAPPSIRDDRDILLARIKHKDFPRFFRYYSRYHPSPPFCIPNQLLADKEVVKQAISRYPEILLQDDKTLPPRELFDSKEVFLSFVQSERMTEEIDDNRVPTVRREHLENCIGMFSAGLLSNAELMLKAAPHVQHGAIFALFSGALSDDCAFALQLAKLTKRVPPNALERFSDRVKADREIVLSLVQKNGLCLKNAGEALKSDVEVVRAACTQYAAAVLYYAPGPTQQSLIRDKEFMVEIFSRWPYWESVLRRRGGELYNMLPEDLKIDHDIAIYAYRWQFLSLSEFPTQLTSDRGFWMKLIEHDWSEMPEKYAHDPTFARAIRWFESKEFFEDVLSRFPVLLDERSFWFRIIEGGCMEEDTLMDLLREFSPQRILRDKELMLIACQNNFEVLQVLPLELQQDRDILEAAIGPDRNDPPEPKIGALQYIPKTVQVLYPDLTAKALSWVSDPDIDMVAESLWQDLEIWKAWFKIDGEFHSHFPETMKDNREFGLLVAQCAGCFSTATSESLRSDKAYMMEAVKIDPTLFCDACESLRRDFGFAVVACSYRCANNLKLTEFIERDGVLFHDSADRMDADLAFLRSVRAKAESKIEAYAGFTEAFVYGLTDFAGSGCHLPILVGDKETSLGLKKLIADFLDVPAGKDVSTLRRAVNNLEVIPLRCRRS